MDDFKWPSLEDEVDVGGKKGVIKGICMDGSGSFIYSIKVGRATKNLRGHEFSPKDGVNVEPSNDESNICSSCGVEVYIGSWPMCPHGDIFNRDAQSFTPTVYDVNAKGEIRFIIDPGVAPKKGYERKTLNTIREVRQFNQKMTKEQTKQLEKSREKEYLYYEATRKARRDDLRQSARYMSPLGKDFAEYVIREGERKEDERRKVGEASFYIGAFE